MAFLLQQPQQTNRRQMVNLVTRPLALVPPRSAQAFLYSSWQNFCFNKSKKKFPARSPSQLKGPCEVCHLISTDNSVKVLVNDSKTPEWCIFLFTEGFTHEASSVFLPIIIISYHVIPLNFVKKKSYLAFIWSVTMGFSSLPHQSFLPPYISLPPHLSPQLPSLSPSHIHTLQWGPSLEKPKQQDQKVKSADVKWSPWTPP